MQGTDAGAVLGEVLPRLYHSIIIASVGSRSIISWQYNTIINGVSDRKMSTMNLGSALSLGKEAKRLSLTKSLDGFLKDEEQELEKKMGMKSDSEYEEESKAKEKTVNHLIIHAFILDLSYHIMRGRERAIHGKKCLIRPVPRV